MPNIDDVRRRLTSDPAFRATLVRDPKGTLQGFELSPEDLSQLTSELSGDHEALDPVEQRTSKAGLFALFSSAMSRRMVAEAQEFRLADVGGFSADAPGVGEVGFDDLDRPGTTT